MAKNLADELAERASAIRSVYAVMRPIPELGLLAGDEILVTAGGDGPAYVLRRELPGGDLVGWLGSAVVPMVYAEVRPCACAAGDAVCPVHGARPQQPGHVRLVR